ncbi:hypothetical protein WICPIJ_009170 [Wickerhamomyces pijperi]|uniref:Protein phosphatase PP2A regulatory subunit B n=1 Tax=Wickerhamomyces pijperi TaxID=599730 RepID=A0A9P8PR98_WICPI|nr:hypothetical protein WICPIJ_009170 [Wickerhamomyces pijperi]
MSDDGPLNFKFSQCFGDKADIVLTEADIISTVEFDHTGDYLATGDRGGRVVLFERNFEKDKSCEYRFHTEFQSHDAEFDYLKSLEIEEKINKIKWCKRTNQAHFLLSTNDKTIKLWKIYEKNIKLVSENNLSEFSTTGSVNTNLTLNSLKLPKSVSHDKIITASPKKVYSNAHSYHINSISINSDSETFLSSDDLRINLWNLNIPDQSFNIVDIKPANMEELTEVITSADFHPQSCNLFMYSSSKGAIKLADMRENALCDSHAKVFEEVTDPSNNNFFTEITSSISDVKFSSDGRYIASRDYLTVKIWDINMEKEPVKTINIHDHLKDKLCDTYENDAIFDKFECVFSGDGKSVMTGSYNNNFMVYQNATDPSKPVQECVLQADRSAFKSKKNQAQNNGLAKRKNGVPTMLKRDIEMDNVIDYKKNILHLSWHPFENSVAIAATNNLYIFSTL